MTRTILVVEDDAAQRELLCALLEEHGYACIGVEDGQRALEVIATGARGPDAVVLDMVLPRLNGHEFLEELSARGEQNLGVVVVSGCRWSGPWSRNRWTSTRCSGHSGAASTTTPARRRGGDRSGAWLLGASVRQSRMRTPPPGVRPRVTCAGRAERP
jgi:chemotaxis response regulator CheB